MWTRSGARAAIGRSVCSIAECGYWGVGCRCQPQSGGADPSADMFPIPGAETGDGTGAETEICAPVQSWTRELYRSIAERWQQGHVSALNVAGWRAAGAQYVPGPCGPTFGPNSRPGRPLIFCATMN